jgi:hypothetical protein
MPHINLDDDIIVLIDNYKKVMKIKTRKEAINTIIRGALTPLSCETLHKYFN